MGRTHSHDKLSGQVKMKSKRPSRTTKTGKFPIVLFDKEADFASIRLAPGIEAKSYLKDGVLFSEDDNGRVIEVQILNVSLTTSSRPKKPRKAG